MVLEPKDLQKMINYSLFRVAQETGPILCQIAEWDSFG